MKKLFFDLAGGVSGDMLLGSLISLGVRPSILRRELSKAFRIKDLFVVEKRGDGLGIKVPALKLEALKTYDGFKRYLKNSRLDSDLKKSCIGTLDILAAAEAEVHGGDHVHFHEVGELDTLVDIAGVLLAVRLTGAEEITASPVNLGRPAPATLKILKGVPVFSDNPGLELATPTGAALVKHLAGSFGPLPAGRLSGSGLGAGENLFNGRRSYLKAVLVDASKLSGPVSEVCQIETNIDDMEPRFFEPAIDLIFKAGALDVWIESLMMKKTRPGFKLSVLCERRLAADCAAAVFKSTTTNGLRYRFLDRVVLDTDVRQRSKSAIREKIASFSNRKLRSSIEYEDLKKLFKDSIK